MGLKFFFKYEPVVTESYFGLWGGSYGAQFRRLPVFFRAETLFICREGDRAVPYSWHGRWRSHDQAQRGLQKRNVMK